MLLLLVQPSWLELVSHCATGCEFPKPYIGEATNSLGGKADPTFELKNPSIPLNRIEDLKKLYRIIATDERNNAVLKPASSAKN